MFETMIVLGDYVMAGVTAWFLCMCAKDNDASRIGFSLMIVLFLSSAILISRR